MAVDAPDDEAKLVHDRWSKSDRALLRERKDFWINCSFYEGRQWISFDDRRRVIENTFTPSQHENERMRVTINKIQERVNMLMGRFNQRNLAFEGMPSSSDDATMSKSRLAESILETRREDLGWESVREENCFNTLMGGTGAIAWEWNGSSGEKLWIDSGSKQIIGKGEVQLSPLSIAEFSVEPGVRRWQDARWWVGCTGLPPEHAKATYGLDYLPDADAKGSSPMRHQTFADPSLAEQAELCSVYVLYEKPNKACEKGRHLVVIGDHVVLKEEWPFIDGEGKPIDQLNIFVTRALKVSGRWTGKTMVTTARQPQILYNIVRSMMAEHVKLAGNARLLMPMGSVDDDADLTDEPGEPLYYWPDQGAQPQYLSPPQLPRWLTNQAEEIEAELDGILHSHAVSRGEAPGDRNSGLALSILAEKNDTPLGPMAREQMDCWSTIGTNALRLYALKAKEKRVAIVVSPHGIPNKLEWKGADIGDQWRVQCPLEAVMPTSKVATQATITAAAQAFPQLAAAISPEQLTKLYDVPGLEAFDVLVDADARKAIEENERMETGEVEIPEKFDDHAVHIAEHNDFRKSNAWRALDDETKEIVTAHVEAHQRYVEEEAAKQAAANEIMPGIGGLPQADEPIGSAVPAPAAEASVTPIRGSAA